MTSPFDPNASAYALLESTLTQWGLSSLSKDAHNMLTQGMSNDQITLALQNTDSYKQRFSANAARIKAGLQALSPAEYIALEGQYKQTMRQYGLPTGFYDSKAETDSWIANDVSATELADRVKMASDTYLNAPKEVKDTWDQWYGQHGPGGAIAAILDPKVAEPILQQEVTAAGIGGAAKQNGLAPQQAMAMQMAQNGVTIDQARKAYQDIATRLPNDTQIASRFGMAGQFGQAQEEQAQLLQNGQAQRTQNLLYSEEQSQFAGHGGAADTSNTAQANY